MPIEKRMAQASHANAFPLALARCSSSWLASVARTRPMRLMRCRILRAPSIPSRWAWSSCVKARPRRSARHATLRSPARLPRDCHVLQSMHCTRSRYASSKWGACPVPPMNDTRVPAGFGSSTGGVRLILVLSTARSAPRDPRAVVPKVQSEDMTSREFRTVSQLLVSRGQPLP